MLNYQSYLRIHRFQECQAEFIGIISFCSMAMCWRCRRKLLLNAWHATRDYTQIPLRSDTIIWNTKTQVNRSRSKLTGPSSQPHHLIWSWLIYAGLNSSSVKFSTMLCSFIDQIFIQIHFSRVSFYHTPGQRIPKIDNPLREEISA